MIIRLYPFTLVPIGILGINKLIRCPKSSRSIILQARYQTPSTVRSVTACRRKFNRLNILVQFRWLRKSCEFQYNQRLRNGSESVSVNKFYVSYENIETVSQKSNIIIHGPRIKISMYSHEWYAYTEVKGWFTSNKLFLNWWSYICFDSSLSPSSPSRTFSDLVFLRQLALVRTQFSSIKAPLQKRPRTSSIKDASQGWP